MQRLPALSIKPLVGDSEDEVMVVGIRAVWLSIMVIVAVLVGVGGGVLTWLDGRKSAGSILAGFGVFAATLVLEFGVSQFLTS